MKIMELKYKPFSIKLKTPFINSLNTLNERRGFVISISDELGNTALGEAAPLPGFSRESFYEAEEDLIGLSHLLAKMETGADLLSIKNISDDYILCPSVKFGFEQAMLGLMINRDRSFFEKLFLKTKASININTVIGAESDETVFRLIENKLNKGFSTFKIKIGRNNFSDDLNLIKEISSRFGNKIKIRLDVNGKWNFEDSKYHLDKLAGYDIEYIEEPCKGVDNLISLSEESAIPIAVDESLADISGAYKIFEESVISFIIIKPMLRGGFVDSSELIKQAAVLDKNIIISSSFETALGKSMLVFLSSLTHHSYAHGLDTAEYFQDYYFNDQYIINNGVIDFSALTYPKDHDFKTIW